MTKLTDLIPPIIGEPSNPMVPVIFHVFVSFCVVMIIAVFGVMFTNTVRTPAQPSGWGDIDYDGNRANRGSLAEYMSVNGISAETPMVSFSVATANFGGIFTEDIAPLSPYNGSVNPEAARLQVEAGARAIVLDIWPDPSNPQIPVVCTMLDTTQWSVQNLWATSWGLNRGVGRYSNWNHLTRNKRPASEIVKSAVTAAFNNSIGSQGEDPFFLILKLHGAMSTDYLNLLGTQVQEAIGPRRMGTQYDQAKNQNKLCNAPVSDFMGRVFTIVLPDIETNYNQLPGINTYAKFVPALLATKLGEVTNAIEQSAYTMLFDPTNSAVITQATQNNCNTNNATPMTLAEAGFCIVQPTIGGQSTDNEQLFAGPSASYSACLQTGAQFVAVNYFSPNTTDAVLTSVFTPAIFGKYSFLQKK